jgi:acyl-CoA thioester hydrolase
MGVVYYANYFVWFEVGRTNLLREAGWSYREMEADGVGLPVIDAHCEYHQPARYDDEIEIRTTGRLLTKVRMEFTYELVRPSDHVSIATGHTIHAAIDRAGRPCRVPERAARLFAGETPGRKEPGPHKQCER